MEAQAQVQAQVQDVEQTLARHRRELKDLQGRITSKKKNATKKTRKGVNDECAQMERALRERQAGELAALRGDAGVESEGGQDGDEANGEIANDGQAGQIDGDDDDDAKPDEAKADTAKADGAKKRNRQKERMARRAAEHEAASARAHEEAGRMTDHRARESAYMRRAFAEHGLVEQDIAPDGHCLFSAVADQLAQSDPNAEKEAAATYRDVRRAAAEYMAAHADDFAPFMEEELGSYVARVRDTAEWGGQLELMALARRYGVEIRVIQDGRTERIGGGGEGEGQEGGKKRTFWLAYYRHGYGLGEHYNSLRVKPATATATTASTASTG